MTEKIRENIVDGAISIKYMVALFKDIFKNMETSN